MTVPMILNNPEQWDHEALTEVLSYRAAPKQAWDSTDIGIPWLDLIRNTLNTEIWSFKHPDFLAVSVTHGTAHLALYDQAMWDKYLSMRGAGVGVSVAVGRLGAIFGPLLAAALLGAGAGASGVLLALLPITAVAGGATMALIDRPRLAD
jgi:hypothetical protein